MFTARGSSLASTLQLGTLYSCFSSLLRRVVPLICSVCKRKLRQFTSIRCEDDVKIKTSGQEPAATGCLDPWATRTRTPRPSRHGYTRCKCSEFRLVGSDIVAHSYSFWSSLNRFFTWFLLNCESVMSACRVLTTWSMTTATIWE